MQLYKHRQIGTLIRVTLGLGIVVTAVLFLRAADARIVTGPVLVILLSCLVLFHALTVEVTAVELVASFGPGLIRKRFRVEDIRDARVVRNKWYYGWGIRLTPSGWMFNVSGLDAVELELNSNRRFRIGTDDPERLVASIQAARHAPSR